MTLVLECDVGFEATLTDAHGSENIASQIKSVVLFLHGVIIMTLSRMTGKRRII